MEWITKPCEMITRGEMVCAIARKRVKRVKRFERVERMKRVERVERMKRVKRMYDIYVYQALWVVTNAERRKGLPGVKLFAR